MRDASLLPAPTPRPLLLGRALASDALTRAEDLLLTLFPQGGQGHSRRNAWQAMAGDAVVAAARREGEEAMRLAVARASGPSPTRLLAAD